MTQKEINKFLDNTKVYVNGKSEEIQEKLFLFGYNWRAMEDKIQEVEAPFLFIYDDKNITHSHNMMYFVRHKNREISAEQILSLEITPSYRPFEDREECWKEMLKHEPFGWLKSEISGNFAHLGCICQFGERVDVAWSTNEKEWFDASFVYGNYTFADGSPFGIKEE